MAFGAVGLVDAIGSAALVYHFVHALRHDSISRRLERISHRLVLLGLTLVGSAAAIGATWRLITEAENRTSNAGVILAVISVATLAALSWRKQQIARRIPSPALLSDGHLTAIGALQACVALLSVAVGRWYQWHWTDPVATIVVGVVAVSLACATWRESIAEASS